MRWVLALVLAGCYAPHETSGSPCHPDQPACPGDEVCVTSSSGSFCEALGANAADAAVDVARADAAVDGASDDRDGDGVPNNRDNCPDMANPDQADEDADGLGDICDPCPPSNDNTDDDGDGVANDCDPNPNVAGDRIVTFEGFHHGVPASWTYDGGNWTSSTDDLVISAPSGTLYDAALPAASKHESVIVGMRVTATVGTAYRLGGVFDNGSGGGKTYATVCGMVLTSATDGLPNTPVVDLYETPSGTAFQRTALAWGLNQDLVVAINRVDNAYNCFGYDSATDTSATAAATDATDSGIGQAGVHVDGATVRFHWLMIVESP